MQIWDDDVKKDGSNCVDGKENLRMPIMSLAVLFVDVVKKGSERGKGADDDKGKKRERKYLA